MRKALIIGLFLIVSGGILYALDMPRHAEYAEGKDGKKQCKTFAGSDDNRSACEEWCKSFLTEHQDSSCTCAESHCD